MEVTQNIFGESKSVWKSYLVGFNSFSRIWSISCPRWKLYLVGFNAIIVAFIELVLFCWNLYLVGFNILWACTGYWDIGSWKLYLIGFNGWRSQGNKTFCSMLEIVLDRVQCRDNAKALHLTMLVGTCT